MSGPNFEALVKLCKAEIEAKQPLYGDEWRGHSDKEWWLRRLKQEIAEFEAASTTAEEQRKLVNVVNLAAMAREMRQHRHHWRKGAEDVISDAEICENCGCIRFKSGGRPYLAAWGWAE